MVQVYVKQPSGVAGDAPVPIRQLVDFKREVVATGKSVESNFDISASQLAVVNSDGDLQVSLYLVSNRLAQLIVKMFILRFVAGRIW